MEKPHFVLRDIAYSVRSPEQPLINTLGAIALYLLIFTVVTSYFRAAHLNDSPIDLLDAEKVGIIACGVVIAIAAGMRFRWTRLHPKYRPPPRLQRALRGTNRAVQSSSRDR